MDIDGTGNEHQKDIACPLPETPPLANLVSSHSMADLNYICTYSLYCFLCSNGGELLICDKCSRAICLGQCLAIPGPPTSRYKDNDKLFICPACH
jgi:hypothetical protein